MTTEWIAYVLLVGALFTGAAAASDGILCRAAMPTRWVWAAVLVATTVLGAVTARQVIPPSNPLTASQVRIVAAPAVAASGGLLASISGARAWIGDAASRLVGSTHHGLPEVVRLSLLFGWLTATVSILVILLLVHRRMDRQRQRWPVAQLFDVAVRITPSEGPAVVGIIVPEIVVPHWLLTRTADEQRLVVVHEREHITAGDHLLLLGGLVLAALIPWHPAVWWAVSRLRLAIELDCDARVLRRGVQVRPYGSLLIDIAGQCAGHRVGALALADRSSHLERRLLAMRNTTQRFPLFRNGSLGALAALCILVACEAKLPTSAEVKNMDVASAEKVVVQAKLLDEAGAKNVVYVVDGAVVSADKAHVLNPNQIAAVRVSKGKPTNTSGTASVVTTVNITTSASDERLVPVSVGSDSMKASAERVAGAGSATFTGLLYVDGVLQSSNSLAALSPNDIASVEVLKGAAAAKISTDPAAANGIIQVTTKHPRQ